MKIISWNVNGLRAVHKKGLFLPFVEKYQPDILCLQEIKWKKEPARLASESVAVRQNELDLPDYEEYWNPAEKPGYAGTAIFVKKSDDFKILSVKLGFPEEILEKYELVDEYGDPNTEGRMVTVEFENFILVNVYTPNSKPDLSRLSLRYEHWDPAFLEHIYFLKQIKPVIFCGDLNVAHTENDLTNPKANEGKHGFTKEEREDIDKLIDAGFVDTFRIFTQGPGHHTWWVQWANARERNIGWRLDYFFVNKEFLPQIKGSKILKEVYGSDHCPILLEITK